MKLIALSLVLILAVPVMTSHARAAERPNVIVILADDLGHKRPEQMPTGRGFDEYLGILYSNDMRPVELTEGTKSNEYPVVQASLTRRYTARALDFIERHQSQPFLLYLAHAMPHKPGHYRRLLPEKWCRSVW